MRQDKLSKQNVILYLCGIIPVVWLGLLIAPCLKDGLPGLVQQFGSVMQNPFQIQLCEDSVKTVLIFLLSYGKESGLQDSCFVSQMFSFLMSQPVHSTTT